MSSALPSAIQIHVLLIADKAADAELVRTALGNSAEQLFALECAATLGQALERLEASQSPAIEIILLDLTLVDGAGRNRGLSALDLLIKAAPQALILVMGDERDDSVQQTKMRELRERGAHDYFCKNHVDSYWLPRILRYATERKMSEQVMQAAEDALFETRERSEITLNSIGDAVLTIDLQGHLNYMNITAERMTGWPSDEALGLPLVQVFNLAEDGGGLSNLGERVLATSQTDQGRNEELKGNGLLRRRNGSDCNVEYSSRAIYDREGKASGAVLVFSDVSESRGMALRMTHLAQHDFLTGLPNRMLLTERLSQAIGRAHRRKGQVGLLFIDLDFFKHINDSLGHAVGDELLKSVAQRLVGCVRATDTVCRQGGDEFVILLSEIERSQDAALTAEKLLQAIAEPHMVDTHELHVGLSIGIAVYPGDGDNADILMQNADAAMYHAKLIGRNNYQFFKMEMNARAMQRAFIESSLRRAIKREEFVLHFQPKMDIASGTVIGAEALLRWQDPKMGLVYPADFLAIAEESGLIVPIGGWVLRAACKQLRAWLNAGLKIMPVAINVSAAELKHKYFLDGIARALKETGLPPYYLELEFTETILMRDPEFAVERLEALREIGVQIAVDDFGTGYSSLSYLKRFPVGTLKIDQSFMRDLDVDGDNATIVSAIIAMGRNLKQRVLAEGVETAEQLAFLRNHRCHEAQGFHLSYPLPAEEFAKLLVSNALPVLCVRQRTEAG